MEDWLVAGPAERPPDMADVRDAVPLPAGARGRANHPGPPRERHGPGRQAGPTRLLLAYLPRGNILDREAFAQRHRLLRWILGLHLPALLAFGMWQGNDAQHVALELQVPLVCLVLASVLRPGRLAALFVAAGLVYCSATLVHLSGGMIEAHFHFFILLGFIALYQDWVPFLWNVAFVVLSHGIGSTMAADSMFNHYAAQNRPWLWASVHGTAVLAACVGMVILWHHTELAQQRNLHLKDQLAGAELTAAELTRRQSVSALLLHLARRNQVLLDQQLGLIADLEKREREPGALTNLFKMDHLATRMRRNAESLLVLSGDEPRRQWGQPVQLADVVRAAAAEVEDYTRVEVLVTDHVELEGRAVADVTHLLAELIENATTFSPAHAPVRVHSYLWPDPDMSSGFLVSIEDTGIGMSDEQLREVNQALGSAPEIDPDWRTLGLQVVSRLARRHGLEVRLAATPGCGVTALVTMPSSLIHRRRTAPPVAPERTVATVVATPGTTSTPATAGTPASAGAAGADGRDADGRHTDEVGVTVAEAVPSAWGDDPAPPAEAGWDPPALTADGLARRVPGQALATELRSRPDGSNRSRRRGPDRDGSRDRLSRFQASQRAGRAAAQRDHGRRNLKGADGDGERPRDAGPEA